MKKTFITLSLGVLALLSQAQNGAYIEYKISSSRGAGGSAKITFSEFGSIAVFNLVVPQMPGGGMTIKSLCQKSNPDLVYMLNDNTKTYSERKANDMGADDLKTYTVKKLADETVNGYKCSHAVVTVKEGNETSEVWNTKDIAGYEKYAAAYHSNKKTGSAKRDQALKDAGCEGLPVKSIHKGNEREGDLTMELVKIEKKNYSAPDFDIPAGYTKGEAAASPALPGMKTREEMMKMTPDERTKFIESTKKVNGK